MCWEANANVLFFFVSYDDGPAAYSEYWLVVSC